MIHDGDKMYILNIHIGFKLVDSLKFDSLLNCLNSVNSLLRQSLKIRMMKRGKEKFETRTWEILKNYVSIGRVVLEEVGNPQDTEGLL